MGYTNEDVRSYEDARTILGTRTSKCVGNNSTLTIHEDGRITYRLHKTDIATFRPGSVTLESGGWHTVTTKERMNRCLPSTVGLYTQNKEWIVSRDNRDGTYTEYRYCDGMTVFNDGRVEGADVVDATQDKERAKLRRRIRNYAARYCNAMARGDVSRPGLGDCFFCLAHEATSGRPLGDVTQDTSHLEQHMDESYYVPALSVNAIAAFPVAPVGHWWVNACWEGQSDDVTSSHMLGIGRKQVEKSIRRYIERQFGFQA